MRFNDNSRLAGKHAFLSASKSAWVNYDEDKLDRVFLAQNAAQKGTDLHALAGELIRLRQPLADEQKTMNLYVNDGIGFRMTPELTLFYSMNFFGTPDTISFRKNMLRIHDLKTGLGHTTVRQLEIYVVLFCLEYGFKPFDIEMELRIYQNNEARIYVPDPVDIDLIMQKAIAYDRRINQLKEEAE